MKITTGSNFEKLQKVLSGYFSIIRGNSGDSYDFHIAGNPIFLRYIDNDLLIVEHAKLSYKAMLDGLSFQIFLRECIIKQQYNFGFPSSMCLDDRLTKIMGLIEMDIKANLDKDFVFKNPFYAKFQKGEGNNVEGRAMAMRIESESINNALQNFKF